MSESASGFRLEPRDEYTHPDGGETLFNESMYCNFYDPAVREGGFLRIGNRPGEGHAETSVCLFRPDGHVLFQFARADITGNDRFEAGGACFEVEEPFERLRIRHSGRVCDLADPLAMRDPRAAFRANPFVPVEIDLAVTAVGPVVGGERMGGPRSQHEREFARGHYEQHHRASGALVLDGRSVAFDGFGLRDHSWGPRSWQAPRFYRWLTASFGADFGFAATWISGRDGADLRAGFVQHGRTWTGIRGVELETAWRDDLHDRLRVRLALADGTALAVEGRVLGRIPLRNRRNGRTTRIAEGLTEWRCQGRTGYGLSEYLDQID